MYVLGIDPSTTNIGVCLYDNEDKIVKHFESFKGKTTLDKDGRLAEMISQFSGFLADICLYNEEIIAYIEYPVVFRNAKGSLAVAESVGWIKSLLDDYNIPVKEVNVMKVKRSAGRMKKEDIINSVLEICKHFGRESKPQNEHEADAYWIAQTGINLYMGGGEGVKKKKNKQEKLL